jgi:DNA-directed RNA polymerase beta' subunit
MEARMGLSHQQLVDLAHRMMARATLIVRFSRSGIRREDVEALRRWRDVIAGKIPSRCTAALQLNAAIEAAEEAVELEEEERAEESAVIVALMIAAAAGALLEVVRNADIELSNN